tara:strand:- start:4014 stop:4154 length:141 start_codon:yes stop_codon:yes gene_type:complete
MSQAARIFLAFAVFLAGITLAHGFLNLGWGDASDRPRLTVGHLPVT